MTEIQTELSFLSRRGLELRANLHQPAAPTRAAVVVCHGMLSSRASAKHQAICSAATARDLAALRFDFAGRGDSQGGPADLCVSGEMEDLRAALTLMRDRGFTEISLVGSSLGGTVAILVAAEEPSLVALVSVAAPAILPTRPRSSWGAQPGVPQAFFDDARCHDVVAAAERIRCPWHIVHGSADTVVPSDDARRLAAVNPGARLSLHAGADHRFSTPKEQAWLVATILSALP